MKKFILITSLMISSAILVAESCIGAYNAAHVSATDNYQENIEGCRDDYDDTPFYNFCRLEAQHQASHEINTALDKYSNCIGELGYP